MKQLFIIAVLIFCVVNIKAQEAEVFFSSQKSIINNIGDQLFNKNDATIFVDDFEGSPCLKNWTVGGRQQAGTNTANCVKRNNSIKGHLYKSSFTEITLSPTCKPFAFSDKLTFNFDMEVRVYSERGAPANFYGKAGVDFYFINSGGTTLGTVSYIAATTQYPFENAAANPTWAAIQVSSNVNTSFSISAKEILSYINVDKTDVATVQMIFYVYSSTHPFPYVEGELWIDNVIVKNEPCVETPEGCSKPKALLIAGHGDLPYSNELFAAAAADLWEKGWLPIIPPNPTLEDVQDFINNDPCIRGLYIHAHGSPNGSVILGRRGRPNSSWMVLPATFAASIPGPQLDFLTVLYCFVRKSEWQDAFPQSQIVVSHCMFLGEFAFAPYDKLMQKLFDWGTPLSVCEQPGLLVSSSLRSNISTSRSECASFAICDSSGCGTELYPVICCADSIGVPTASEFFVAPPDSMFSINLKLPVTYSDSMGCVASYFSNVPEKLVHPDLLPLGRYLVFADAEKDTLIVPESITLTMKYLDSDLIQAGIEDEMKLVAYWMNVDSEELQQVPVELDTVLNCIKLSVPRWGLVGIYRSDNMINVQEQNRVKTVPQFQLNQNYPNPFNPTTTISFTLAEKANVQLEVFDINGKLIRTLIDGIVGEGNMEVIWDGKNNSGMVVSSGTYFYQLRSDREIISKKVIFLK